GLGRGYTQLLDQVNSAPQDEFGIAHVNATGTLFSRHQGVWTMDVDTKKDYLIDNAQFVQKGNTIPCFSYKSAGVHDSAIPIYAGGVVTLGKDYQINEQVLSYTPSLSQAAIGSAADTTDTVVVRTVMDNVQKEKLSSGGLVMDFRQIDSNRLPGIER